MLKPFFIFCRTNKGVSAGFISLFCLGIFSLMPRFADAVYRNGIFQIFRLIWDHTFGLMPFPTLYLELMLLPFIFFFFIRKFKKQWSSLLLIPINLFGWLFSIFLWMWGYNYCCTNLTKIDDARALTEMELTEFHRILSTQLDQVDIVNEFNEDLFQDEVNVALLEKSLRKILNDHGVVTWGNPTFRNLGLGGLLRRLGVAGIYIPYVGEACADKSFLSVTLAFIRAHELAHAYGVTSEAEADYFAYAALTAMELELQPSQKHHVDCFKWAGQFELFRSVRYQLHLQNDSLRVQLDSTLSLQIQNMLKDVKSNATLYPEFFPGSQDAMNDRYLKLMGIKDGVKNYDKFIELIWMAQIISEGK